MWFFNKKVRHQNKSKILSSPEVFSFTTIILNQHGVVSQENNGYARQVTENLPGGIILELVEIPGGIFQMGSHREGGYPDERPVHPVYIRPFLMGKYPITQAQWQAIMGRTPGCRFHGKELPVENICWNDAKTFCEHLTKITDRIYRLPSEAQWEYACRAGSTSPFYFGETITTQYSNYVGQHTFRYEPVGVYRHSTTPVGSFPPNAWGLYDMHGNVWEFCADEWFEDYNNAPVDDSPRVKSLTPGHQEEPFHSARGGSWHETPAHCRSAMRLRVDKEDRMEVYGMRVSLII